MGITKHFFRLAGAMFALGAFFLVAAGIGFLWINSSINSPLPVEKDIDVIIQKGTSISGMGGLLKEKGVIEEPFIFKIAAFIMNSEKKLKAGEYRITAGMSVSDIVTMISEGKTVNYRVTIPEGYSVRQILNVLNSEERLTGDIETAPQEGTLFPDTYTIITGETRKSVIDKMQASMNALKTDLWDKRDADIPFKSWEEAVTMASIVEKETGIIGEMPRIAGVFINRLKAGIPLQSDPTVVYAVTGGLGDMQEQRLLKKHLETDSLYNTYLHAGLPPGPIANPGKNAINAVLHPEKNSFFYFVADGTGGHVFSETLAEHNVNVMKWRKIRKENEAEDKK